MREYAASEIFPGFYSIQSQKSVSIKSHWLFTHIFGDEDTNVT